MGHISLADISGFRPAGQLEAPLGLAGAGRPADAWHVWRVCPRAGARFHGIVRSVRPTLLFEAPRAGRDPTFLTSDPRLDRPKPLCHKAVSNLSNLSNLKKNVRENIPAPKTPNAIREEHSYNRNFFLPQRLERLDTAFRISGLTRSNLQTEVGKVGKVGSRPTGEVWRLTDIYLKVLRVTEYAPRATPQPHAKRFSYVARILLLTSA